MSGSDYVSYLPYLAYSFKNLRFIPNLAIRLPELALKQNQENKQFAIFGEAKCAIFCISIGRSFIL
jgi:hypothetical protein